MDPQSTNLSAIQPEPTAVSTPAIDGVSVPAVPVQPDPAGNTDTSIQQSQPVQADNLQDVEIPVEVQVYLEELIKDAHIPVFDDETKKQVVHDLFDRLDKYLSMKIAENLTEEETEEFIKLNEEGKSRDEIDAFIAEHIPDAQAMFTQAFVDFRDFYLTAQANFQEVANAGNPK